MLPIIIFSGIGIALIATAFDTDDDTDDAPAAPVIVPDADTAEGTPGPDRIDGGDRGAELLGYGGDDLIGDGAGGAAIDGGAGNDSIFAGAGDDFAVGGEGDDRVFLGDGDDVSVPDPTDPYDAGDDFIRGGAGQDLIIDHDGANTIFGDVAGDLIDTNDAPDTDTPDTVHGGVGDDLLRIDDGDIATGGADDDLFEIDAAADGSDDPVTITDFDPLKDGLFVFLEGGDTTSEATIDLALDTATGNVTVTVNDVLVATLLGIDEAGLDQILVGARVI